MTDADIRKIQELERQVEELREQLAEHKNRPVGLVALPPPPQEIRSLSLGEALVILGAGWFAWKMVTRIMDGGVPNV